MPPTANGDESAADDSVSKEQSQQPDADVTNTGSGGPAGMTGWTGNNSFNGMNPFMANPMFNFPQGMGMLTSSLSILFFALLFDSLTCYFQACP